MGAALPCAAMSRRLLALLVALSALLLALTVPATGQVRTIKPGISAAGVDLSGLTVEQAAARLDQAYAPRLQGDMILGAAGVPWKLTMAEAQLKLDSVRTAKRALYAKAGVTTPPTPGYSAPTCRATPAAGSAPRWRSRATSWPPDAALRRPADPVRGVPDLPGNSFIGPRFAMRGPTGRRAQPAGPQRERRPGRCGSCPSSSRVPSFRSELTPRSLPCARFTARVVRHRYRRGTLIRCPLFAVPEIPTDTAVTGATTMAKTATTNNLTAEVRSRTGKGASAGPAATARFPSFSTATAPNLSTSMLHGPRLRRRVAPRRHQRGADPRHRGQGTARADQGDRDPPDPPQHPARRPDHRPSRREGDRRGQRHPRRRRRPGHPGHPGGQHHRDRGRRACRSPSS